MLRRLGVGMLALAAVALVAMSPIGLQGQGGPILLGGVGPLSEPGAAESGAEMKMAMELAVDELNAQGGVLGREVRLQFEDTRGLPEEGAAAMNRLADAGAVGVAGEFHSAVAKAEIEVANARKLPFVIAEAWSDSLTAAQYPYVFRIAPAVSLFYTKVADWIRAAGFKNVVAIYELTDFGIDVDRVLKTELTSKPNLYGESIQYTSVGVERTVPDFTPQLLQFKAQNPDLVVNIVTGTGGYLIVKQAAEVGLATTRETAMLAVSTSILFPEFWETAGEAGLFTITKRGFHPLLGATPAIQQFQRTFEERYGRTPTFAAMEAYDAIKVLAAAIEQAGSTDPDAIVAALEQIEYDGVLGTIYFSTQREPAYMYHQWPGIRAVLIQYTEVGQKPDDAHMIWPLYLKP